MAGAKFSCSGSAVHIVRHALIARPDNVTGSDYRHENQAIMISISQSARMPQLLILNRTNFSLILGESSRSTLLGKRVVSGNRRPMFSVLRIVVPRHRQDRRDEFRADLRDSLRQLRKAPGFTTTAVITLALESERAPTAIFHAGAPGDAEVRCTVTKRTTFGPRRQIRCSKLRWIHPGMLGIFRWVFVGGIQVFSRPHSGVSRPCCASRRATRRLAVRRACFAYAGRQRGPENMYPETSLDPSAWAWTGPALNRRGRSGRWPTGGLH